MPRISPLLFPIVFSLPAMPAFADITPQELWDNFQSYSEAYGQTLTAEIAVTENALIASDVTLEILAGEDTPPLGQAYFPALTLTDTGSGSVQITLSDGGRYIVPVPATEDQASRDVSFMLSATGEIVASGTPNEITYTFDDTTLQYNAEEVLIDGASILPALLFTLEGINGTVVTNKPADMFNSVTDITANQLTYIVEGTSDEAPIQSSYKASALTMEGSSSTRATPLAAPLKALQNIKAHAKYTLNDSTFALTAGDASQQIEIAGTSKSDSIDFNLDAGILAYGFRSHASEFLVSGAALPVPQIDLGIEDALLSATLPMSPSNDAQPIGLQLGLDGVRIPQIAWAILDPQNQLPHDPADLQIDLTGEILSELDFFNPTSMEQAFETGPTLSPVSLSLNTLLLNFAGAELLAQGDAKFVQNGTSAGPFPQADAQMALSLSGITPLIETLAQSGIIPAQMVATAQFMLSAFARPGDGPDTYETDVKLDKQGTISVNGLPLPF